MLEDGLKVFLLQSTCGRGSIGLNSMGAGTVKLADVIINEEHMISPHDTKLVELAIIDQICNEASLALEAHCLPEDGSCEVLCKTCLSQCRVNSWLTAFRDDSEHEACLMHGPQAWREHWCPLDQLNLFLGSLCCITWGRCERPIKIEEDRAYIACQKYEVTP